MPTPEMFVGIDVSKTQWDIALRPTNTFYHVANTPDGIAALVETLQPVSPTLMTIEATGGDERDVAIILAQQGWAVAVVNPRQVRSFARIISVFAMPERRPRWRSPPVCENNC